MKIYEVTLSYTTKVFALDEKDAIDNAWDMFEPDFLKCESVIECDVETPIIVTKNKDEIIPEGKHKVECEICDCYLIYGNEVEEQIQMYKDKPYRFIKCPICDDMIKTYGYNWDGEYFDDRIE